MQDLARMFSQAALSAALPMATASETPGDICQLDPHGTQGGVDPEITALRAEVARLRADLASSHLDACERAIDRMGWPEINAFMAQPAQALSEDAGGYLRRKIKTLFGIKPDAVETYQHAARMMVNEARAALESTDQ